MKTIISSFGSAVLSREQMKSVKGGGSSTADCGFGKSVTCTGSGCEATNSVGCCCNATGGGTDTKNCPEQ